MYQSGQPKTVEDLSKLNIIEIKFRIVPQNMKGKIKQKFYVLFAYSPVVTSYAKN